MKCDKILRRTAATAALLVLVVISFTCQEALPTYTAPKNVLAVNLTTIEQLNDHVAPPGAQVVHFVLLGENIHDEVFQDSVDIKGTARIWWKRKPDRYRTVYLTEKNFTDRNLIHNRKLMLVPGQKFSMDIYWDLRSDLGVYLPEEMDFARLRQRSCASNVACATPEDFVVEVSLNIFDRLGYVSAPAREFKFVGRICVNCGYPPCPVPPGGCG